MLTILQIKFAVDMHQADQKMVRVPETEEEILKLLERAAIPEQINTAINILYLHKHLYI
jgi:hypothetical protein